MRNTTTRARWDWLWGNATSHTHKTSSSQLTHHVLLALARHPAAELYEWKIVATANRTFEIVFMLSSVKTLNYCCLLLLTFFSYHNSPLLSHAREWRSLHAPQKPPPSWHSLDFSINSSPPRRLATARCMQMISGLCEAQFSWYIKLFVVRLARHTTQSARGDCHGVSVYGGRQWWREMSFCLIEKSTRVKTHKWNWSAWRIVQQES